MASVSRQGLFNAMDRVEFTLCKRCNRMVELPSIELFFRGISRLGNGLFWYSLMVLIALFDSSQGLYVAIHMIVVGILCLTIYKLLKNNMIRERPCITWKQIKQGTVALDVYSFPSGHTLHAVAFTTILLSYYPTLAWLVIPFTVLTMLSRIVLGLHYPSDVLIGAFIGGLIAYLSLLMPMAI